jgi:acetylornithine deacetylase/succinyl-diaminopimelate desuccinylase-like protein
MTLAEPLSRAFSAQDVDDMVAMASDLVNIPSETGFEGPIGDYVAERFAELGMDVEKQEVEAGRNNVIARLVGDEPGPTLLFLAHFDTSTNPGENLPIGFQPIATVRDGWISGLGISNMKCAFAGFHSAIRMLQQSGTRLPGEIVVAGVVGEIEKAPIDDWQGARYRGGGIGARFMLNHGLTADFCINGEPTALRLQTGNAGYMFIRIRVHGSPQATYSKATAVDPVPKAFRIWEALQDWEPEYQAKHEHRLMKPLVSVGGIYGGYPYKPSITPAFCNLYVHVNLIPGQSMLEVRRDLEDLLHRLRADDAELTTDLKVYLASNGHEVSDDLPVARAVASAHQKVFGAPVGRPDPARYSVSSDNSPLLEFGIPGITYGAGGINQAGAYSMYQPGVGEVVKIDNLAACARVYAAAAASLLVDPSGERS